MKQFDIDLARAVIPVEIGAELQGTWVNRIGQGAAKEVRRIFEEYIDEHGLSDPDASSRSKHIMRLSNGWTIAFGSEPDVSIRDADHVLRGAIEIKGSMDVAGAQTRYGEAKKSFAKALAEFGQCETIYLASCFTTAVLSQIRQDQCVRKIFNLVEILADEDRRREFVDEIFLHVIRIRSA